MQIHDDRQKRPVITRAGIRDIFILYGGVFALVVGAYLLIRFVLPWLFPDAMTAY